MALLAALPGTITRPANLLPPLNRFSGVSTTKPLLCLSELWHDPQFALRKGSTSSRKLIGSTAAVGLWLSACLLVMPLCATSPIAAPEPKSPYSINRQGDSARTRRKRIGSDPCRLNSYLCRAEQCLD